MSYQIGGREAQLFGRGNGKASHYSPLSGVADLPENYHTVTIELSDAGNQTQILLTQDKNTSEEERAHSQQNWEMMLAALKNYLEQL
jgi:hypothetical protein